MKAVGEICGVGFFVVGRRRGGAVENFPVELLHREHGGAAGERVGVVSEFAGGGAGGEQRDDVGVGQRRLAAELNLRLRRAPVDVGMHEVVAQLRVRLEIERGLKGLVLFEINEPARNAERAEGQTGLEGLDADAAVEVRLEAGASELEIHRRRAVGEVAADEKGIVRARLDREVEFPFGQRGDGNGGVTVLHGVRRGLGLFAGQRDGQDVDLFEKPALREKKRAAHHAGAQRAGDLHIAVGADGDRVVALEQDFFREQVQVEDGLGQLGHFDGAAEFESAAAEFAVEGCEGQRVAGKAELRVEDAKRGNVLVHHARTFQLDGRGAAEHRLFHGARHAHVHGGGALDAAHGGREFWHHGEGGGGELHGEFERQRGVELLVFDRGVEVERDMAFDGERLELRLFRDGGKGEFLVGIVQVEIEVGGFERDGGGFQCARIEFQMPERREQRAAGHEVGGDVAGDGRLLPEAREKFFEVEFRGVEIGGETAVERDELLRMIEVDGQDEVAGEHGEFRLHEIEVVQAQLAFFQLEHAGEIRGAAEDVEFGGLREARPVEAGELHFAEVGFVEAAFLQRHGERAGLLQRRVFFHVLALAVPLEME